MKLSKNEQKEIERYKKFRKRRQRSERHQVLTSMGVARRIGKSRLGLKKREKLFQDGLPF